MSLLDLLLLYGIVGVGCAAVVYRRTRGDRRGRITQAALALPLWPVWAPIALIDDRPSGVTSSGRGARIEAELEQAVRAAADSPFEILLSADAAARIRQELSRVTARITELDEVLAQPGFDRTEAEARVDRLMTTHGSRRALKTAILHRDNVARIQAVRDSHQRALDELGELIGALRSQLVLARYAGSAPEGVGGIVSELWARVEGLGEAMESHAAIAFDDE